MNLSQFFEHWQIIENPFRGEEARHDTVFVRMALAGRPESATIDLDGDPSEEQMLAAESRTNEVIWEDRPVTARFVSREELASLALQLVPHFRARHQCCRVAVLDAGASGPCTQRRKVRHQDHDRIGTSIPDHDGVAQER